MIRTLLILLISSLLFSCQSRKKENDKRIFIRGDTIQMKLLYQQEAEKNLPLPIDYLLSPQGAYMLCYNVQRATDLEPQNYVRFMVYDLKESKVVYKSEILNGRVSWYSEANLEIFSRPGIMAVGQTLDDYIHIYNIITKQSRLKTEVLKSGN